MLMHAQTAGTAPSRICLIPILL